MVQYTKGRHVNLWHAVREVLSSPEKMEECGNKELLKHVKKNPNLKHEKSQTHLYKRSKKNLQMHAL
jgi:hypothetical protein